VAHPTATRYEPELTPLDYINLSGGFSRAADRKATYVLRANGDVMPLEARPSLQPGDAIVVPVDPRAPGSGRRRLNRALTTVIQAVGAAAAVSLALD
jgi:protein involved in polysaccharide export with SLBB domain